MKYLGIDYGEKRVGIAVSDDSGSVAFPRIVLDNDKNLVSKVSDLCCDESIEAIVLGESKNFDGKENIIMAEIKVFKKKLEEFIKLPIYFEPEFLTSAEALHIQGKNDMLDASAATLILKSFLDKERNKN